jgi:hypothetical protein
MSGRRNAAKSFLAMSDIAEIDTGCQRPGL